jgi:hypothetical protein
MEHHKQVTELAARIIEVIDSEDHLLIEEAAILVLVFSIIAQTTAGEERADHVDTVFKLIRERIHQLPEVAIAAPMKQ